MVVGLLGRDDDEEDKDGDERDDDDEDQEVVKNDDKDDTEESGDDDNEETRDEESFDPIPQTPKSSEDEGDGEEDQGLNIGEEERHDEEEEEDELYRDVKINQGRGLQASLEIEDSYVTLTLVKPDDQRMNEAVQVTVQLQSDRLREEAQKENDEFLRTVDENIKKIIKEQVKEQALVDAYESDKIILDTYRETVTLKRRRNDDEDKDEEPSAGPDRGSKRRREGKEPESASTPSKNATKSVGRVDTLTPKLLAEPTYELMKGSCKSLIELEYHLEEVYKATTNQLDWVNPREEDRCCHETQDCGMAKLQAFRLDYDTS
nr:hypothetical protein [Tanacetum cinerariifolium]